MATVNLGAIKFNWKGAYSNSTAYAVDDVVSSGGSSYVCIQAHTNQPVGNATAYWNIMSSAGTNGTNGTDVGTVITTQGDILYRDGSGLQRLGAGTSGQVLQTGGTGANPSWTDVSGGDVIKLASGTLSGSSVSIDGYYSSTYDFYKLILMNVRSDTSGRGLWFRYNTGGSALTSANYRYVYKGAYASGSSPTDNQGSHYSQTHFINGWDLSTGGDRGSMMQIDIYDPLDTNNNKFINWTAVYDSTDASNIVTQQAGGYYNGLSGTAMSGMTVFPQADNFAGGIWKLYGYKA